MPTWNELFLGQANIDEASEAEIYKFVSLLEKLFSERPLHLWDLCCGAGRHTVLMASMGHRVYASDNAPNAIDLTCKWLAKLHLRAEVELADMIDCPWQDISFHGVVSWNAVHHNTLDNIQKAIDTIYRQLIPGGLFVASVMSTKADGYSKGQEIEPQTFVQDDGFEAGVPHHYFDEASLRALLAKWELLSLAEQVVTYVERGENFLEYNPFDYTKWLILARKKT